MKFDSVKIALTAQREAMRRGYALNPMPSDGFINRADPKGLYLNVVGAEVYLYAVRTEPDADGYTGLFPTLTPLGRRPMATAADANVESPDHCGYVFAMRAK